MLFSTSHWIFYFERKFGCSSEDLETFSITSLVKSPNLGWPEGKYIVIYLILILGWVIVFLPLLCPQSF